MITCIIERIIRDDNKSLFINQIIIASLIQVSYIQPLPLAQNRLLQQTNILSPTAWLNKILIKKQKIWQQPTTGFSHYMPKIGKVFWIKKIKNYSETSKSLLSDSLTHKFPFLLKIKQIRKTVILDQCMYLKSTGFFSFYISEETTHNLEQKCNRSRSPVTTYHRLVTVHGPSTQRRGGGRT